MRTGIAVCALVLLASACPSDKGQQQGELTEPAVSVEDDSELVSRRDALLETRRALALKRADLDSKRKELEATGADTTVIEREVSELVTREREIQNKAFDLSGELLRRVKDQQTQLTSVAGQLSGDTRLTVRESQVASRESQLARREKALAARELALATREEGLASKWKDSCATGGPIFTVPTAPAGSKYRKRDVEKNLRKARAQMRKRGILTSDLSPELRNLSTESEKAMKKGDYGQAHFAAEQLAKGVSSIKIGKAFVSAKFARAKAKVSGKLSDRDEKLLLKITEAYGDGRYRTANRSLNDLMSR